MTNCAENYYMEVDEVIGTLGVSKSYAYKVIKKLNGELKSKGFMTLNGKISRRYFNERFYGMAV